MTPSEHRTAVLLDEHPLWLDGVEQVLARIGIEVKGKATSPEHALALIEEHGPSLFVTSIEMSDGEVDGLECLSRAKQRAPELKVIVLSAYGDPQYVDAARRRRRGLRPEDGPRRRPRLGHQAFDHSIYLARGHNGKASAPASRSRRRWASPAASWRSSRSWRKATNAQLARMLWVTEQTVKFHLSNIYRKLNVSNRTEASRWAQVHGLLPLSSQSPAAA